MPRLTIFTALLALLLGTSASAQELARESRRSPDGRFFVGWFDHDAGAPFGLVRVIVVRSTIDSASIFSIISTPRSTDASWNPASNRCVVADAPDNGGPRMWLVYQKKPDEWSTRELDPFASLSAAFYKADPEVHHLFRPGILKMAWLSDAIIRFRGLCNMGTYFITLDTSAPEKPPQIQKLSDQFLDE